MAQQYADPLAWRQVPVNSLFGIAFGRPGQSGSAELPSCGSPHATPRSLLLNSEAFTAQLGEKGCFLGNTIEYQLLTRLNHRPGLFVSLDALRASVWKDEHTTKNTIQRTISNLRRKLRDAGLVGVVINGVHKDHYRLVLPA